MDLLDNEKLMVKYQHCLYMNNMPRQLFPCYLFRYETVLF